MDPAVKVPGIAFDNPDDPRYFYGGCYQGSQVVLDAKTGETKDVMEYPTNLAWAPAEIPFSNWNAPLIAHPMIIKTMYHGEMYCSGTTNGGINSG